MKGPNWNRNDSRLNARTLSWQGNTKQLVWKNAAHHVQIAEKRWTFDKEKKLRDEEQENAKKEMITKTIKKDHSDMIINW